LLIDLMEEPGGHFFGLCSRFRARGDDLDEVVIPLGQRVTAGVDADAQDAAGQRVDAPAVRILLVAAGTGAAYYALMSRFMS
jgi:hypothetical protein